MKKQIALKYESYSKTVSTEKQFIPPKPLENVETKKPKLEEPPPPEEGTRTPNARNRYRCCWCTRYFSMLRLIKTHECKHAFMCTDCDPPRSFKSKLALADHLHIIHKAGEFKCDECKYVSSSKTYLDKHKERVHKDDFLTRVQPKTNQARLSNAVSANIGRSLDSNDPRSLDLGNSPSTAANGQKVNSSDDVIVEDNESTTNRGLDTLKKTNDSQGTENATAAGNNSSPDTVLGSTRVGGIILEDNTFLGSVTDLPADVVNVAETLATRVISSGDSIADDTEDSTVRDAAVQESLSFELTEYNLSFDRSTTSNSRSSNHSNQRGNTPQSPQQQQSPLQQKQQSPQKQQSLPTRQVFEIANISQDDEIVISKEKSPQKNRKNKRSSPVTITTRQKSPIESNNANIHPTPSSSSNLTVSPQTTAAEKAPATKTPPLSCKKCKRVYQKRRDLLLKHEKNCTSPAPTATAVQERSELVSPVIVSTRSESPTKTPQNSDTAAAAKRKKILPVNSQSSPVRNLDEPGGNSPDSDGESEEEEETAPPPPKKPSLLEDLVIFKSHEERMRDMLSGILPDTKRDTATANNNPKRDKEQCKKCMRTIYPQPNLALHMPKCRGTFFLKAKVKCPFCRDPKRYFATELFLEQHLRCYHRNDQIQQKWKEIKKQRMEKEIKKYEDTAPELFS
eukprot:TRINITY_DN11024_c0_g1_i9.p1 TRINITY_DN11024_c0_g1~~TRINITY_DN11024_c0_g1_i9.p1  ORF type:complete len:680 (-),score=129.34 TRINITY_DN11024_c0_g1_i9:44-2083(-)